MAIQYTRARRENVGLLIGLAGFTGSGKTFSAMELATGICNGQPFCVIDTEGDRAKHYADDYDFEHKPLGPPFSPDRYLEALVEPMKRGFRCIVVDSASHEWSGTGGVVDMADKDSAKSPGNWRRPKEAHSRFVNAVLQARTHIIFCLRAKDKIRVEPDPDKPGKTMISHLGWTPIQERDFMYEMTVSFTLAAENPGIVNFGLPHKLQDQHRMAFPPGQHISREAGEMLGAWARGDAIETPDKKLWDRARKQANEGRAMLKLFVEGCSEDETRALRPIAKELNNTAREADRNLEGVPF